MSQKLKGFKNYVLGIGLIALVLFIALQFQKYPVQRYCDAVTRGMTVNEVFELAEERGLIAPTGRELYTEELIVYNNNWKVLRYGCRMEIDWEKVQKKEFISAW